MVVDFLNLVRWKNLLIAGVSVILMKYAVFHSAIEYLFPLSEAFLGLTETLLLAISVMLIAAAGYVINDVNDVKADEINKPDKVVIGKSISVKLANNLYIILNVLGLFLGAYVGKVAGNYKLALLHLVAAGILWIYSSFLKNSFLIGNLLVAASSALVPITYFIFESNGYISNYGSVLQQAFKSKMGGPVEVLYYFSFGLAAFAFVISLIREIIKDLQDYKGDLFIGANTLPLAVGDSIAKYIIVALCLFFAGSVGYVLHVKLNTHPFNGIAFIVYTWLLVIAPVGDVVWGVLKASDPQDYQRPSNTCKFIMVTGTLVTLMYAFNV